MRPLNLISAWLMSFSTATEKCGSLHGKQIYLCEPGIPDESPETTTAEHLQCVSSPNKRSHTVISCHSPLALCCITGQSQSLTQGW